MAEEKNNRGKVVIQGLTKGLIMAVGAGAVIGVALLFPGLGWVFKEFQKEQWEKARKRGSLGSTIKRLEKQNLISWKDIKGQTRLTLTEEGRRKVLQYNIDELTLKNKKKDGYLRVVIFDIPEEKRDARDILREKLKMLEFTQLQKSAFVSPYECKDEIDFLRHSLEIAPYVHYILAKKISNIVSK